MKVVTKIGSGRTTHAASYDPKRGTIKTYCDSLKFTNYLAAISDPTPPNQKNVSCKKCLKKIGKWGAKK